MADDQVKFASGCRAQRSIARIHYIFIYCCSRCVCKKLGDRAARRGLLDWRAGMEKTCTPLHVRRQKPRPNPQFRPLLPLRSLRPPEPTSANCAKEECPAAGSASSQHEQKPNYGKSAAADADVAPPAKMARIENGAESASAAEELKPISTATALISAEILAGMYISISSLLFLCYS